MWKDMKGNKEMVIQVVILLSIICPFFFCFYETEPPPIYWIRLCFLQVQTKAGSLQEQATNFTVVLEEWEKIKSYSCNLTGHLSSLITRVSFSNLIILPMYSSPTYFFFYCLMTINFSQLPSCCNFLWNSEVKVWYLLSVLKISSCVLKQRRA